MLLPQLLPQLLPSPPPQLTLNVNSKTRMGMEKNITELQLKTTNEMKLLLKLGGFTSFDKHIE